MVTSGNSSRSWLSTAADAHQPVARGGGAVIRHRPSVSAAWTFPRPGQRPPLARVEDQPVLPDLDLVAVGQLDGVDPLAVDVRAVEAADVGDREAPVGTAAELHVAARDGHVVQEDVALRVTAGRGQLAVQQEAAARVRPAAHHQERRAQRQRVDGGLRLRGERRQLRLAGHLGVVRLETGDRDGRGRLGGRSGATPGPQRRAAVGAEAAGRGIACARTSYKPASPTSTDPPAAAAPRGHWWHTDRSQTLHPYLRLTVPRNLCGRHAQGQQTTRPECHRRNRPPRRGTAGARRPAPPPRRGAEHGAWRRCRHPGVRSCRTTSQTTSRAIPLDRNRPARGAGRTQNQHTCRPGHPHNVRIRQTVSTTHHCYEAATPRNLLPLCGSSHACPHQCDDD